ncbi:hypothetical protein Agabi119p4_3432 [Agaricus bisporus var. burnettii]|uniref:Uncharacterized protein n=1 Tax=Agaricus bisporus var. burnettii TaxID=192524 RepID=A0A8H7F727_AGABI|nr:hypothetical protein Agabi119p4_3432 [Agaricus bisporus var. burnettii]
MSGSLPSASVTPTTTSILLPPSVTQPRSRPRRASIQDTIVAISVTRPSKSDWRPSAFLTPRFVPQSD